MAADPPLSHLVLAAASVADGLGFVAPANRGMLCGEDLGNIARLRSSIHFVSRTKPGCGPAWAALNRRSGRAQGVAGLAVHARLAPRWPFCPPCARPGRARRASRWPAFAFASAAGPSWLGGCEEFDESRPACRRSAGYLGPQRLDQRGLLRYHRQQFRVPGSQLLIRQLLRMRHPRTQP
jgi:hypothetical protein